MNWSKLNNSVFNCTNRLMFWHHCVLIRVLWSSSSDETNCSDSISLLYSEGAVSSNTMKLFPIILQLKTDQNYQWLHICVCWKTWLTLKSLSCSQIKRSEVKGWFSAQSDDEKLKEKVTDWRIYIHQPEHSEDSWFTFSGVWFGSRNPPARSGVHVWSWTQVLNYSSVYIWCCANVWLFWLMFPLLVYFWYFDTPHLFPCPLHNVGSG